MKAHKITIVPVLNGFHVTVGCQQLAFHDKGRLVSELDRYLDNPDAVTSEYLKKYGPLDNPMPAMMPSAECAAPTRQPDRVTQAAMGISEPLNR